MSRRATSLLATCVLVASATGGASAQSADDLLRQADSLAALLPAAEAAVDSVRELRVADRKARSPAADSVRVGPLLVVTPKGQGQEAERLFAEVWAEYEPFLGKDAALEANTFGFRVGGSPGDMPYLVSPSQRVEIPPGYPDEKTLLSIRQKVGYVLGMSRDGLAVRRRWVGADIRRPERPRHIYRQLVLRRSAANRRCLEGDAMSCWSALGADAEALSLSRNAPEAVEACRGEGRRFYWRVQPVSREVLDLCGSLEWTPYDDWYDPSELRPLVQSIEEIGKCTEGTGDCRALLAYIHYAHGGRNTAPLGPEARQSLLWLALEAGGEGAWERLAENPDLPPGDALRYASGLTTEELASRWRDWVLHQTPPRRRDPGNTRATVFWWFLILGLMATRSTRWRFA